VQITRAGSSIGRENLARGNWLGLYRNSLAGVLCCLYAGFASAQTPESFRTPEFNASWGLGVIGAEYAYALGFTGAGVMLGIADHPVQPTHPEFAGRLFYPNPAPVFPVPGFKIPSHGTHVMGLAAAARDNQGMMGVAFNASLAATVSVAADGYPEPDDWVGDLLQAGASVMNGSFGPVSRPQPVLPDRSRNPNYAIVDFQLTTITEVSIFHEVVTRLSEADVVMVFAAGNDSLWQPIASSMASGFSMLPLITTERINADQPRCRFDAGARIDPRPLFCFIDESDPRADLDNPKTWNEAFLPADSIPYIDGTEFVGSLIAVVATDRDNKITDFSNRCGETADWCIAAPGLDLLSSVPMDIYAEQFGTSMAAPLVAGTAALLREAFPYMTARQIIEVILTNATDLGNSHETGHGLLNVRSAIGGPIEFGKPSLIDGNEPIFPMIFAVDTQGYDSVWRNDIRGVGGFSKAGQGMLTLTGRSTYLGDTTITGGELRVNGVIENSYLLIEAEAVLSGTGTVANTFIRGTLSPGNSVGTLTVDGDLVLADGSVFLFEIDADQRSDFVAVTGLARIESGAIFDLWVEDFVLLDQPYQILTAGELKGSFESVQNSYTFIDLNFATQGHDLSFVIERNTAPMSSYAQSSNQRAVAQAIDSQSPGNEPFNVALLNQNPDQLPSWFQDWSGEIYATNQAVVLGTTRLVSQRLGWRLQDMNVPTRAARQIGQAAQDEASPWADVYGNWQRFGSSADAAAASGESANVLFGVDRSVGGQFRFGGAFGVSQINTQVVNSRASTTAHHLALYGGGAWQALELGAGVVQSWYDVGVTRAHGSLPEGDNAPSSASLNGNATTLFVELGVPLVVSETTRVTPFVQVNQVWQRFGGFQESSGSAPLRGQSSHSATGFSTLGVRSQVGWQAKSLEGHVTAMLGWQRGWGDLSPSTTLAFTSGNPFVVKSSPLAKDALALELGMSVRMGPSSDFSLVYAATFGGGNISQSVQAQLQWRF